MTQLPIKLPGGILRKQKVKTKKSLYLCKQSLFISDILKFLLGSETWGNKTKEIILKQWIIHFFCFIPPSLGAKYEFKYIENGLLGGVLVKAPASQQCGWGSNPSINANMWVEYFWVFSPAPRGFSLGSPLFPSPRLPNSIYSGMHSYILKELISVS